MQDTTTGRTEFMFTENNNFCCCQLLLWLRVFREHLGIPSQSKTDPHRNMCSAKQKLKRQLSWKIILALIFWKDKMNLKHVFEVINSLFQVYCKIKKTFWVPFNWEGQKRPCIPIINIVLTLNGTTFLLKWLLKQFFQ